MVMRSWFRLSDSNFTIDNEASDDATVVRIFGSDTPFCAAVQANIANGLGLTICSASTHEGWFYFETVFGVTDREGNKVTDEATISDIRAVINRTEHRPQITRVSVLNDGSDYAAFLRATRNCLDMWDNPLGDSEYLAALPRSNRVDKRTLLNPSHYCEERCGSKMYALVTTRSSMSRDLGTLVPCLWLDSGASHHMVGDITILINLRDLPIRRVITTADGSRLAVAKVGDIQMPDIKIRDVFFVPGLQMSLVSVRQLGKNKVVTTFYENHAELWSEGEQIGGAVVDDTVTLYKLRYLH